MKTRYITAAILVIAMASIILSLRPVSAQATGQETIKNLRRSSIDEYGVVCYSKSMDTLFCVQVRTSNTK